MARARGGDGRLGDHRRALGRYGEKLALEHLRARGFSLLARNYRTRRGEIDLCQGRLRIDPVAPVEN